MLLAYILKGIPENCTLSIVDMTNSKTKSLCSDVNSYVTNKNYEVISLEKCIINNHVDYFIRVIEIS